MTSEWCYKNQNPSHVSEWISVKFWSRERKVQVNQVRKAEKWVEIQGKQIGLTSSKRGVRAIRDRVIGVLPSGLYFLLLLLLFCFVFYGFLSWHEKFQGNTTYRNQSTAMIRPISSNGKLTAWRTIMVVTEPADGMPAAPMAIAVAVMLNSKNSYIVLWILFIHYCVTFSSVDYLDRI